MKNFELKIGEEKRRGKKFGIYAGVSCLRRFKTLEEAKKELEKNRSIYEFWAGSVSVSVQNSKPQIVFL